MPARPHAARRAGRVCLLLLIAACSVDLPLRDDVAYTCERDADCPLELTCATLAGRCVSVLDQTPPRLTSIAATSSTTVALVFDEELDERTASLPASFAITRDDGQRLAVEAVELLPDDKSAVLRTGVQRGGAVYAVATRVTDQQANIALLDVSTFVGFGPGPNTDPPEVTAPARAAVIVIPEAERGAPQVTLAWTPRSGAIGYALEVSLDESFDDVQLIDVDGKTTSHVFSVAEGTTYFWRVRSDATRVGEYGSGSFTVLFDTLYVSCPADASACRSADGIGSKNVPLASISRAVSLASDRGVGTIAIAARGGNAVYHEPIGVTGGALTLRGGYTSDFNGTVDPALDPTTVEYEVAVLTVVDNSGQLLIEGLTLRAIPEALALTQPLAAANLSGIDADVVFRDSILETSLLPGSSGADDVIPVDTNGVVTANGRRGALVLGKGTRVVATDALNNAIALVALNADVTIDGAELVALPRRSTGGDGLSAAMLASEAELDIQGLAASAGGTGLSLSNCTGTLRRSTIIVAGQPAVGISLSNGSLTIDGNRVFASSPTNSATGMRVGLQSVSIANNTVVASAPSSAIGLFISDGDKRIVHNTVLVGDATESRAILTFNGISDFANNLLVCLPGPGASAGILENTETSDPSAVVGNVVVGCDAAYVDESGTTVTNLDTLAGQVIQCSIGTCGTTRASANATLGTTDPFVSVPGADSVLGTVDDDLRLGTADPLLTEGGIDTASNACGTNEAPRHCGNINTDLIGAVRSPPPSVGAYEKE